MLRRSGGSADGSIPDAALSNSKTAPLSSQMYSLDTESDGC